MSEKFYNSIRLRKKPNIKKKEKLNGIDPEHTLSDIKLETKSTFNFPLLK